MTSTARDVAESVSSAAQLGTQRSAATIGTRCEFSAPASNTCRATAAGSFVYSSCSSRRVNPSCTAVLGQVLASVPANRRWIGR